MAQVSVHGVGGRGSERLRAEASRLRRPTRGHVVLRAARSFLPAFSQPSTPILFGLSLQVCQVSRRGGDVWQSGLGLGTETSEGRVSVKLAWHLEGAGDGLLACPVPAPVPAG